MKSSNIGRFCGHTTKSVNSFGYENVCGNWLHCNGISWLSEGDQSSTHAFTPSLTHGRIFPLFLTQLSQFQLSFNANSSGEWKFQILNQKCRKSPTFHHEFSKKTIKWSGAKVWRASIGSQLPFRTTSPLHSLPAAPFFYRHRTQVFRIPSFRTSPVVSALSLTRRLQLYGTNSLFLSAILPLSAL